ncbi:MAG: hypothetical protein AAF493_11535 [Pseudomonadota bacterium]
MDNRRDDASIIDLGRQVLNAFLRRIRSLIPDALAHAILTFCGLIVLVTPLGLWVAWTERMFFGILAGGLIAFLIALAVIASSPDGEF